MYGQYAIWPHNESAPSSSGHAARYNSEKKTNFTSSGIVPGSVDQKIIDTYLKQTTSQKALYKPKRTQIVSIQHVPNN